MYSLPGRRRPYVSNVAKALGLTPPSDLALVTPDGARRYLSEFHSSLRWKAR